MLRDMISSCARNFPTKIAFHQGIRAITWSEIDHRSTRLAQALSRLGVGRDDVTAILSEERLEVYEHWFACMKVGAVRVGINWRYAWPEIRHIIEDSGAKVLLVDAQVQGLTEEVRDRLTALGLILIGFGAQHGMPYDYETLLSAAASPWELPQLEPTDRRLLTYTSGTTGVPKGVVLTDHAIQHSIVHCTMSFGVRPDDIWYRPNQSSWVVLVGNSFGLANGMTMVIPDGRFDINRYLADIERLRITVALLIPTALRRLLDEYRSGRYDLSSLRLLIYGGGMASAEMVAEVHEVVGCDVAQVYGLTEAGGWVSHLHPSEHRAGFADRPQLLRSAGRVSTHFQASIRDDDGNELPPGEVGVLWLQGESLMREYHGMPELTRETLVDGALCTHDMGSIDEDGYLYLKDRKNFLIVTGGVNVFPSSVEAVLHQHPAVEDVAVVGVPHEEWGEAIVAVVVLRNEAGELPADELHDWCSSRLARMELPKAFLFWEALPKTPNGKVNKREARDRLLEQQMLPWIRVSTV